MKKIFIIVIAVSMVFNACKTKSESKNEGESGKPSELNINPEAVVLVDVSIQGMTCTGCENTVKSSISELPGVLDVSASFTEGKAIVKLDTSLTKMDKISEKVSSKGYVVTGHKLSAKTSSIQ